MRKLIIIPEETARKYDINSIRNNEGPTYIWKMSDDERTLLKLLRKYDCLVILGDSYLYETIELLRHEKPFSYYNFTVEFLNGKFYEKSTLKHNLGAYLYKALQKRADK